MNLHEFQAKEILARYGVPHPGGRVAYNPDEAEHAARVLGSARVAVKAQVHAGGRGRTGGVKLVDTPAAAKQAAQELLGKKLVTDQTGPDGRIVRSVYVETGVKIAKSLHVALLVDGSSGEVAIVGSATGGEDIEERARSGELKLEKLLIGTGEEPRPDDLAAFAARLGLEGAQAAACAALLDALRRAFVELDASLIEINPLAVTDQGELLALDVKMVIDDNALFRHPDLAALRDPDEMDDIERKAQWHQVNYVRMDGDIGVVVNGAGLALATLDMIRDADGRPGNFMDIRTTAKSLDIAQGFSLVLDNPRTRAVLINVHGGGMQACDTIMEGVAVAMRRKGRRLPIVARLAGNNADFARARIATYGFPVIECATMGEAAMRVVALAKQGPAQKGVM